MASHHPTITIVKLILYYFAYQLGFSIVFHGITMLVPSMGATMTLSLAMIASTGAMSWHLIRFGYVTFAHTPFKRVSLPVLCTSMVFILAAMYVLNLLIEQAHLPNSMEATFIAMSHNPFGIISIALMGPLLEELLFRGAIQGILQRHYPRPWLAIIVASLIFGLVHMNWAQIPYAFILGMLFGWLYYRTGSLLPCIAGHVLNNTIATITMRIYGTATLEEQIHNPTAMWLWAVVAAITCGIALSWLNKNLK